MTDQELSTTTAATVPARLSGVFIVTTGVATHRAFYEALGWRSTREDHAFVPFPLSGATYSLFDADVAGPHLDDLAAAGIEFTGAVLGIVVDDPDEVDAAAEAATAAGGRIVSPPAPTPYGRSLWFVDPSDTVWEVSWIDGMSSAVPFSGAPVEDAVLPNLDRVTVLAADLDAAGAFYAALGWPLTSPPDGGPGADIALGPITFSLRGADGPEAAPVLALERSGLPGRRVVLTMAVAPELVGPGLEHLIAAGATALDVEGDEDAGRAGPYVADVVGMPWAVVAADA